MEKKLSKNVEGMKFMQRKREAEHRAKLQEEQDKLIKESHWVLQKDEDVSRVSSVGVSEVFTKITTSTGRKSFGSFNPAIEKLNTDLEAENRRALQAYEQAQKNPPSSKKSAKPGNNVKWIKKVQGDGGLDGAMDMDTISAVEMAQRISDLTEDDDGAFERNLNSASSSSAESKSGTSKKGKFPHKNDNSNSKNTNKNNNNNNSDINNNNADNKKGKLSRNNGNSNNKNNNKNNHNNTSKNNDAEKPFVKNNSNKNNNNNSNKNNNNNNNNSNRNNNNNNKISDNSTNSNEKRKTEDIASLERQFKKPKI